MERCWRENMSLDVYLDLDEAISKKTGSGIFVRENGRNKEISREEWEAKFPGKVPVVFHCSDETCTTVYDRNITHNLTTMAHEANIYEHLWKPEEIGIEHADQLIEPLTEGLKLLKSDPDRFKQFNPSNGWGNYEGFVDFVADYLEACKQYPEAKVSVSR